MLRQEGKVPPNEHRARASLVPASFVAFVVSRRRRGSISRPSLALPSPQRIVLTLPPDPRSLLVLPRRRPPAAADDGPDRGGCSRRAARCARTCRRRRSESVAAERTRSSPPLPGATTEEDTEDVGAAPAAPGRPIFGCSRCRGRTASWATTSLPHLVVRACQASKRVSRVLARCRPMDTRDGRDGPSRNYQHHKQ